MSAEVLIERRIVVFAIWFTLGTLGLCLVLQAFYQDLLWIGLAGIATLALGFSMHLVANRYFVQTFTRGEIAFGTAAVTLLGMILVVSWFSTDYSLTDMILASALTGTVVFSVLAYLVTRYGARGAFSRFHGGGPRERDF